MTKSDYETARDEKAEKADAMEVATQIGETRDMALFKAGFDQGARYILESAEVKAMVEAVRTKCMCWPTDDSRHSRNPCDACKTLTAFSRLQSEVGK